MCPGGGHPQSPPVSEYAQGREDLALSRTKDLEE